MFWNYRNWRKLRCQVLLHFTSCLDQLLGGQPRSCGGRRSGLRLRVVVRLLQLVAGEDGRVAGRVRSAQQGLELREHLLVLRGRRLGHGSQAGAHGQHPRSHGHSGVGRAVPGAGRESSALPTSPTLFGSASLAPDGPLSSQAGAVFKGAQEKPNSSAPPRVNADVHPTTTFSRPAPPGSLDPGSPLRHCLSPGASC